MELEGISVAVRERSGWSAIDLGFSLARQWWRGLFLSWLLPASAVFTLFHLVLHNYPGIAILLTWWLKPVYDRFPLYILSKRLFGESVSVTDCLRNWRSICRFDMLPWLLWRRLNPLRSFIMPVTLLEGLGGRARQRRLAALQMRASGYALWLTTICIHIETLLVLAALFTVFLLVPPEVNPDLVALLVEAEGPLIWAGNLLSLLAMALVAPFYVSSGFTLYINRRIDLEAWDIELTFRRLAQRLRTAAGVALLGMALALCPGTYVAQATAADAAGQERSAPQANVNAAYAQEQITAVLAGEAFHETQVVTEWRWKHAGEGEPDGTIPGWLISAIEQLGKLWPDWELAASSGTIESVAWWLRTAVVAALLFLLLRFVLRYRTTLRRWIGDAAGSPEPVSTPPQRLFGLAVASESLPADVPVAVNALWSRGEHRAALALLYRGALSQFLHHYHIPFTQGLTELECAALVVANSDAARSEYFNEMTRGWMRLAYGHIEPGPAWVQRQCERWQELFSHA